MGDERCIIRSDNGGGIVYSGRLSATDRNVIEVHFLNFTNKCSKYTDSQFNMLRGDSVQGLLRNCKLSLRVAVYLKAKPMLFG